MQGNQLLLWMRTATLSAPEFAIRTTCLIRMLNATRQNFLKVCMNANRGFPVGATHPLCISTQRMSVRTSKVIPAEFYATELTACCYEKSGISEDGKHLSSFIWYLRVPNSHVESCVDIVERNPVKFMQILLYLFMNFYANPPPTPSLLQPLSVDLCHV